MKVEEDKWSGPHPQRFKIYRLEDMVAGKVSKFTGNADCVGIHPRKHGLAASCSKPCELETIFEIWEELRGSEAKCFGAHVRPAWGVLMLMGGCGVEWSCLASKAGLGVENGFLRESLRTRGWASICYTLTLYQTSFDFVLMSSWYSAGCGWPLTVGSGNGRRSDSLDTRSKDEGFCLGTLEIGCNLVFADFDAHSLGVESRLKTCAD